MSPCVWTAAHVDKDGDQSQRGKDGQLDWAQNPRKSCTLLHDSIHQQLQVKGVRLYALCFVSWRQVPSPSNIRQHSGAGANFLISWHLQSTKNCTTSQEEPVRVEDFPVHTTIELLQEVAEMMGDEIETQPPDSQDRVIFMSMYNDIDWTRKDNRDTCCQKLSRVSDYARQFPEGGWCFLGPGDKVVWDPQQQTKWRMELSRRNDDAEVRREWSSSGLRHKFFVKRSIEE